MSIVTKTGDKGETSLFGGDRVPKDATRIEAYGTVDELNALIGVIVADARLSEQIRPHLQSLQHLLFRMGADLATPLSKKEKVERMSDQHVAEIELAIQDLEVLLPAQKTFILPGGSQVAAFLHLARAVCRRAERLVVKLHREEGINTQAIIFLNRLSDYLFLLARKVNVDTGKGDIEVRYE